MAEPNPSGWSSCSFIILFSQPLYMAMIVDCDMHPTPRGDALLQFLSRRWREHWQSFGYRARQPFISLPNYQPLSPFNGCRLDAQPGGNLYPGSDLGLIRAQLLDRYDVRYALMMPLLRGPDERNTEFAVALTHAANDWQASLCDQEPRLKAAIHITMECPEAAIREIEMRAGDRRFTHVMIIPRCLEPLGRQRYRSILAACAAHGLPIALHQNGTNGCPVTGGGLASFYFESHSSYTQTGEALLTSLVVEGVFEQLPKLRVVFVESGFAWLPSLTWRLDKHFQRLRQEVPHLRRLPSQYIRDHLWLTTQPIEEPERPDDLLATCEWIGWDRLMFSTDYPHWDFDDPNFILLKLSAQQRRMIFHDNAVSLFDLDD